jgi:hypothetical protein
LADLVDSGGLADAFAAGEALVIVTSPAAVPPVDGAALAARLAPLPVIVLAIDRPPGDRPPIADSVIEPAVATLADILDVIDHHPVAATALALLLRGSEQRSLAEGLITESATYSLLQAGPEFTSWRAQTRRPLRGDDGRPAVRIERTGDRLDLVLDRPAVRNALNRAMRDGLLEGLALARADRSITDVVISGDGPVFCSGGDLDEFGTFDDPASAHVARLMGSIGRAMVEVGPPVRAVVHGPCAGSGVELPAFAHRVTARPDYSAALPEITLGLVPGAGGTVSVTRRIGRHRTALLGLSGARIDATTALGWGLIDEITT